MAKPKTKQDKVDALWDWLLTEFPLRRKAILTVRRLGPDDQGYVVERPGEIEIVCDDRLVLFTLLETIMHEFAHVKSRRSRHGQEFLRWVEIIESRFWQWKKSH